MSGHNLFFQSILPEFFKRADLDYAPQQMPFNRAIWALSKGELDVAGPYSMDALGKYAISTNFQLKNLTRVEVAIDRSPIFALFTDPALHKGLLKKLENRRVAILRDLTLKLSVREKNTFRPKSLDQLVKLLLSKRADIATVTKKDLDLVRKLYGDKAIYSTPRPILFQEQFLFVRSDAPWLKERLETTLHRFTKSDYHQVRWEKYSVEKEWQD
ncbi:hypothetical protein RYZ26_11160 [Terasakiella sp. A23]|uniref:hypothetical protein n=1 Tax=Terasakiella sp. FCG-A23 TaxID=3080561 RepID=UPI0029545475|nr:hypothetical protein [Terasakiella sp. A23]MDV7340155.1 hypothetical protein [Terasakiella sp. A23]